MKKKTSIFLVILLCILVAVAGGGVSYLYFANAQDQETQALNDQIDKLESQVQKLRSETKTKTPTTETTTQTTTTTADPTANWQTYTNSDYGFRIKYPTNWKNRIVVPQVYFQPTDAGVSELYVEKYNGSVANGITELSNRITNQFGNACGFIPPAVSTTDVTKFGKNVKQLSVLYKTVDCQDSKIVSNTSYSISQTAYVASSSKGTLLIWMKETNSSWTGDSKTLGDLQNSVIDTIAIL